MASENESHYGAQDQPVSVGIGYSISPGVPCPETVLVAVMTGGGYLLIGRTRDMPVAFVAARDANPLRHALHSAFGDPPDDPSTAEPRDDSAPRSPAGCRLSAAPDSAPGGRSGTTAHEPTSCGCSPQTPP